MSSSQQITRVSSFKSAEDFRAHLRTLRVEIPCDDEIIRDGNSPLAQPLELIRINGKRIANRFAVQPMEGWDGTTTGGVTDRVIRRWRRFGASGSKLICGGEAMAVRPDGRANPNQLILSQENQKGLAQLV